MNPGVEHALATTWAVLRWMGRWLVLAPTLFLIGLSWGLLTNVFGDSR